MTSVTADQHAPADPVAEAFRCWMRVCTHAGWTGDPGSETVPVHQARGRITGAPVRAHRPVPAYRAAAMDGVAVATHSLPDGTGTGGALRAGDRIRLDATGVTQVDTGDPVPDGADAVVMREHLTALPDGGVELHERPVPGRHIRPVGEDVAAGASVLPAGHRIRPVDVAAMAATGHGDVRVRRRPVVAILPTGDEVRPAGAPLQPGEIPDTNSLMLAGLAEEEGCEVLALPIAPDLPDRLAADVDGAAARADVVLVIAGSSAGRGDHTGAVIGRLGRIAVRNVAMRPGHPVILGVLCGEAPQAANGTHPATRVVPVVGVPGYPASAERAFDCFVRPLLRRILGTGPRPAPDGAVEARLGCTLRSRGHVDEYLRVRLAAVVDPRTGQEDLVAVPLPRGAGALSTLAQAEAVLRIPVGTDQLAAGTAVRPVPVPGAAFGAATSLVAGSSSPATDVLAELHRADIAACALHWVEADDRDAVDMLATGLCHAAVLALPSGEPTAVRDVLGALTARLGPVTALEMARAGDRVEVLVVPAVGVESGAVERLRGTLASVAFRHRLQACPGYESRPTGRETWHSSTAATTNGSLRCATR